MSGVRERVKCLPLVRTAKDHRLVVRAFDVHYRSRLVRPRAAFEAREWLARGRTAAYRLAAAPVTIHLRHGTSDSDILEEIFGMGLYEPPAPVAGALRQRGDAPRVLDLGGHVGMFGAWALSRWPAAQITAVEADPANAAVLQRTIRANPRTDRWTLIRAAAAARPGRLRFRSGAHAESALDPAGDIEVPAIDVLPLIGDADLLKIDIEGGEWEILADPRFAQARPAAVALEHHPAGAPSEDHGAAAHALLRGLGYETAAVPGAPAGAGMLWAWVG